MSKYFRYLKRVPGVSVPLSRTSVSAPENWPPGLKKLRRAPALALKLLRGSSLPQNSEPERAGDDDLLTMMRASGVPRTERLCSAGDVGFHGDIMGKMIPK